MSTNKNLILLEGTPGHQKFKISDSSIYRGKEFEFWGEALANGKFWAWSHTIKWSSGEEINDAAKKRLINYVEQDYPNMFEFE